MSLQHLISHFYNLHSFNLHFFQFTFLQFLRYEKNLKHEIAALVMLGGQEVQD